MEKRLAVVTGANRGIGLEIARQLAHKGLRVVLTSRDQKRGLQVHKVLAKEGYEVFSHELDVTRRRSVAALARYLSKEHGRADVLVNNAGIMTDKSATSVLDESEELFHDTLETNFFGALRLCQAVVPLMQKHHYGRVVNLSSGLGQLDDMGGPRASRSVQKGAETAVWLAMLPDGGPTGGFFRNKNPIPW